MSDTTNSGRLDFTQFPSDKRLAQIPGRLVLADNIVTDGFLLPKDGCPDKPVQIVMGVCLLCVSGRIELEIDLADYTLTDGFAAFVPPGSFMHIKEEAPDTKWVFFAIAHDLFKVIGSVRLSVEFSSHLKRQPVLRPRQQEFDDILLVYKELKRKLLDPDILFKNEVAKSYLRILQCDIVQQFASKDLQNTPAPKSRKEALFLMFLKEVKAHYIENRNISFYAERLCVTPKYLSSVVHATSGKHASDWINQHVLMEAKTRLKNGVSVKDVSRGLHFANQSFFAKYFKQHTGYTPKEFKAL